MTRLNPFQPDSERRAQLDAWGVTAQERTRDTVLRFAAGAGTFVLSFVGAVLAAVAWSWPGATSALLVGGLVTVLELAWIRGYQDDWYAARADRWTSEAERDRIAQAHTGVDP